MTHPVETAGHCWSQGKITAQHVYESLQGYLEHYSTLIPISHFSHDIKYFTPQVIAVSNRASDHSQHHIQLRVQQAIKGQLMLTDHNKILERKRINALPERRITLSISHLTPLNENSELEISIEKD